MYIHIHTYSCAYTNLYLKNYFKNYSGTHSPTFSWYYRYEIELFKQMIILSLLLLSHIIHLTKLVSKTPIYKGMVKTKHQTSSIGWY